MVRAGNPAPATNVAPEPGREKLSCLHLQESHDAIFPKDQAFIVYEMMKSNTVLDFPMRALYSLAPIHYLSRWQWLGRIIRGVDGASIKIFSAKKIYGAKEGARGGGWKFRPLVFPRVPLC